ncbi:apolipoprotein D-like [Dreissena polymorpha]|uniref:apolipoprotein D-like n=1 Tax=Dreissena polymorpha TaxID=45954 RepID=UPI002265303C|nr:apolipoprotein D-like [Dreissena polymorpha]
MLPFLLLCFCASIVYGQVPVLGKCPNVTVKMDFEPSKYFGFWYEIARFYTSFEANQKCHSATYTSLPSGHFQVFNQALDMEDHEQNATGDAYIPDPKVKAKIKVKFNEAAPYADYWVVDTDYETYTLVFSCVDIVGVSHLEFAWILARKSSIDQSVRDKLYQTLESFGVKSQHFMDDDKTDCH